jgi:hypothetical protein
LGKVIDCGPPGFSVDALVDLPAFCVRLKDAGLGAVPPDAS